MTTQDISKTASLVHSGPCVAILRLPMSGSCAIPLAVTAPQGVDLLGWAFTDFGNEATSDPSCLLVLGCPAEPGLRPGQTVLVRTHMHDVRVTLTETDLSLSDDDRSILAKLLLASLSSANADRFGALLPMLAVGLDGMAQDAEALTFSRVDDSSLVVSDGVDFIPKHLLARTGAGYVYRSVDSVAVRAGAQTAMTLSLSRDGTPFDRAILIGAGRHAVARIAGAA